MENLIIIVIIIVLLLPGIHFTRKHFRHESSCCGGGGTPAPVPEKKLEHIIGTKIVTVEGMTCNHCKNWVEKSINAIDGASGKVDLKKKEAVVSMEREVSDQEIRTAIEQAGYKVTKIRWIERFFQSALS